MPFSFLFKGFPRRASALIRAAFILLSIITFFSYLRHASGTSPSQRIYLPPVPTWYELEMEFKNRSAAALGLKEATDKYEGTYTDDQEAILEEEDASHPIDTLIAAAELEFNTLFSQHSTDLETAAARYRVRRGRHPPPGFDIWFHFAQSNDAVIVEEFFDQIYHDLAPFWGIPAVHIRNAAADFEMAIKVRNGTATADSDWFWTRIWLDLVKSIEGYLPDMDIALNAMDEPRIVVPWEDITTLVNNERKTRVLTPPNSTKTVITSSAKLEDQYTETREKIWEITAPYWAIAVRGCPPESEAFQAKVVTDYSHPQHISLTNAQPHITKGYVSNYTLSNDICHQPDLQSLHGALIEPLTISTTKTLFPLFGGSKLTVNNEILLPAPMYWNNEERFSGADNHALDWASKFDRVIWRGVATGGKNKRNNWKGFQRHRFVAMTNATQMTRAENLQEMPPNWDLPHGSYNLIAQREGRLGEWMAAWSDTSFVDLNCGEPNSDGSCPYIDPYFSTAPAKSMAEQFINKYVPDIDGNSFSGRYRGFLMSSSVPIKATLFREWHDARLVAWKHFVPMDNRFVDFWGIMEYFLGFEGLDQRVSDHDQQARRIAEEGQEWADRVLRKEDMKIYVLRLLLEYARVCNDERANLGFVADLL